MSRRVAGYQPAGWRGKRIQSHRSPLGDSWGGRGPRYPVAHPRCNNNAHWNWRPSRGKHSFHDMVWWLAAVVWEGEGEYTTVDITRKGSLSSLRSREARALTRPALGPFRHGSGTSL